MSLVDALLEDALLEGIVQSDIYIAFRIDDPAGGGAGTFDDPFDGSTAAKFDAILNSSTLAPTGSTIRIGPGTYNTAGFSVRNGLRIVGAGMGITALKLTGIPANELKFICSTDAPLMGFEIQDLTLDANFAGNSATNGVTASCLKVWGEHVYIHDIHCTGFGSKVSMGEFPALVAADDQSVDCVVANCRIDGVGTGNLGEFTFIKFGGATIPHRLCVIRNCIAMDANNFDIPPPPFFYNIHTAFDPGFGIGTIIEGNQVANIAVGVQVTGGASAAQDLIVWDNEFWNVWKGFLCEASGVIGRMTLLDNYFELASNPNNLLLNPIGVKIGVNTSAIHYNAVLLRRNTVRDVAVPAGSTSGMRGMDLSEIKDLICESNVINNIATDWTVRYQYCTNAKFFDNTDSAGTLLRGYEAGLQRFTNELEDFVQDSLLAI